MNSPEFFINMKKVPTPESRDFDAFVRNELNKIQYGININGVHISNWLYWHLNYWQLYIPSVDPINGEVVDKFTRPDFRDNEWIIANALEQAKKEKKGIVIIGSRRIAKTSFISSWLGLGATIYQGSQNVIVGNNKGDIGNITSQMDRGLGSIESFLRYPRLLNDWKKEVALGFKDKKGNRTEWSQILIKNTEDGVNTEVLAGLTPKTLVYDEIGKAPIKEAFLAGIPAFDSPYGWRCVPICTGTGGDFEKGKDAEEIFNNPDRFNLLGIEVNGENRKTGIFISGLHAVRMPRKEISISEYLQIEKGSELDTITIKIIDSEKGLTIIEKERAALLKAHDQKEYLKAVMYAPLTPEECFLSNTDENPFPVEALKKHLEVVLKTLTPKYVKLYRDIDGKVKSTENTNLKPISDFPINKDTNKDAPIVIYEDPEPNSPNFLNIAGGDPYNIDESINSSSLGTIYIYKRAYDPINGTFQNRIVASFASRPETMKDWHETVELLLEYYNATLMIENAGTNFVQHMDSKNKSHWLADGYNLAKQVSPKTSIQGRIKGLPPTQSIQRHYRNLIIEYCTEKILIGQTETGEAIEVLGLTRIDDPMLLVELINYKPKLNVDRIVAFGHVLIYNEYLEKIAPNIKINEEETVQQKKYIKSPFILRANSSPFIIKNNDF